MPSAFSCRVLATALACLAGILSAPGQVLTLEDVTWKSATAQMSVTGSSLLRVAGAVGWTHGAISDKYIIGDGYIEWRFNTPGERIMVGLDSSNPNADWTSMVYAIYSKPDGTFDVRQNGAIPGSWVAPLDNSVTSAKVFRIERSGTTVKYYAYPQGGTIGAPFYTSTVRSQGALLVDTSFCDPGGQIVDCRYTGAPAPEDVLWTAHVNTTATYLTGSTGSALAKALATSAFDSDAVSSKAIVNDGYVQFRFGQVNRRCVLGLATANPDRTQNAITYAFLGKEDGKYEVLELGVSKTTPVSYAVNDVFRIQRTGNVITFLKNDSVVYTSAVPSAGELLVDTSFYNNTAEVTNVQYDGTPLSEPVAFTDLVGTNMTYTPQGSRLAKNAGQPVGFNADARGAKSIPGSGLVSFSFGQTNLGAVAGLASTMNVSPSTAVITYGIYGRPDGTIAVLEAGTSAGTFGTYTIADRFTVRRAGTAIQYLKNGVIFRETPAVTGRLWVDTAFEHPLAAITNCVYYGVPEDVIWRERAGCTPSYSPGYGSTLSRGAAAAAWNAGAIGNRLLLGDGYLEFRFSQVNRALMIGFSIADTNKDWDTLDYAIYGTSAGDIQVREAGTNRGAFGTYTTADTFRIQRSGSQIQYFKNDAAIPFYTSTVSASYPAPLSKPIPLLVDSSLNGPSGDIERLQLHWQDSDSDGMDDEWEYAQFGGLQRTGSANDDSDEFTDLEEFLGGTEPAAYNFNGIPILTLISGDRQSGPSDTVLPNPLVVRVRNAALQPLAGAPLTFSVIRGSGSVAPALGTFVSNIVTQTDAQGYASVDFKLPLTRGQTSLVVASLSPSSLGTVTFVEGIVYEDDIDADGIPDGWEELYNLNLFVSNASADPDSDGLTNLQEYNQETNPNLADTDGDGLTDGWEVALGGDPRTNDSIRDSDQNGLTNAEELALTQALRGQWDFNETAGTAAADSSGKGNHGSLINGPTWTTDPAMGAVLTFDGTNDRVQVSHPLDGAYNFGTASFSLLLAFRNPGSGSGTLIAKINNPATAGFQVRLNAGAIQFDVASPVAGQQISVLTGRAFNESQWHALAVSVDQASKVLRIYVDGVAQTLEKTGGSYGTLLADGLDITGNTAATATSTEPLVFGSLASGLSPFSGSLDGARLYGKSLSALEAQVLAGSLKNIRPTVFLTSPAPGPVFPESTGIPVSARAYDPDGSVISVDFRDPQTLVVSDNTEPFGGLWSSPTAGIQVFRAIARDNRGETTADPIQIEVLADSNFNGLPDTWELFYFGNLNQTATGDFDGDGLSNIEEFRLGRNPTKAALSDTTSAIGLEVFTPLF